MGDAADITAVYSNRSVLFRFMGEEMEFRLSHGLFSSYDVDTGTRLLLKSVGSQVDLTAVSSVLDVGCGVGVLGIAVKRKASRARLLMTDRDALAVAFARRNAELNGLAGETVRVLGALGVPGESDGPFDLIVSNLPAKAGEPVLRSILSAAGAALSPAGRVAVVIVRPLAAFLRGYLLDAGADVIHEEAAADHAVCHFRLPTPALVAGEGIDPYLRTARSFDCAGAGYRLETVYGLPEFDTLSFASELAAECLASTYDGAVGTERLAFWNPGQGHLPVFALRRLAGGLPLRPALASRDLLQLAISARNVEAHGSALDAVDMLHTAALDELPAALGGPPGRELLVCFPDVIPAAKWELGAAAAARAVTGVGGEALFAGRSSDLSRLERSCAGLRIVASRKKHGMRAFVARRR